ncbi:thiamine phosphate synthase [Halarcobacter mediterraneus]|uniref:Thiamine-phosphate synthase n=1 Tax=Halarcobacter mediterraneus TaxID=2023153 RepID=A0A4Q1AYL3_9BACT|nr:thiamine phosphate synthase [Halarcobacter mediterraneus]RXK14463.1 thiamine phosphate synthase [Halarcobacter mediterraneus]
MSERLKGLYVISDDILTPKNTILKQIEEALKGGAKIVQLRDKISKDEEIEELILKLQELCRRYQAIFILNDRIELAIKLKCDGLHIGKSDHHRVEEVRKDYKGILGISCYGNLDLAKEMERKNVDYVAFGSFFTSKTKPNAPTANKKIIKQAKEELKIPVCVIGGITSENSKELIKEGANMTAVISDIWKSTDIKKQCESYNFKI